MEFRIHTFSTYTQQFLKKCPKGSVHSVYKKTVNLILDGQLLALQANGSPLSPLSLITCLTEAEMQSLPFSVHDQVTVTGSHIRIGAFSFPFSKATALDTHLKHKLSAEELSTLSQQIPNVLFQDSGLGLSGIFQPSAVSGSMELILDAARHYTETAKALCLSGCFDKAASELTRFIGLGPGLTPSGDDFLCGVLAGLRLCFPAGHPFATALSKAVSCHLSDTNDISAAFLRCALNGQFSQAVISLTALPPADELTRSFRAIGHSSGIDTLCGIYYALQLAIE